MHPSTGPVQWVWPTVADPSTPENQKNLKLVTAWLKKHGTPGSYGLVFYRLERPPINVPPAPNWPFIAFSADYTGPQPTQQFDRESDAAWVALTDNKRTVVLDFELTLKSPPVALTTLQNRFQFGNPMVLDGYPDPVDPGTPAPPPPPAPPDVSVGREFAPGKAYALDTSRVNVTDSRGQWRLQLRETPFGPQYWYEKVP